METPDAGGRDDGPPALPFPGGASHRRSWVRLFVLTAGLACTLLVRAPVDAQGQGNGGRPLNALSRQTLNFGTLFTGTATKVSRQDALRAGQFELGGVKGSGVGFAPGWRPAWTGQAGAKVPLPFGPAAGGYALDAAIGTAAPFDPRHALISTLSSNGRLYIFLGGTATPAL